MASSLNEANLERRLQTVTNTQESIQTLSLWCLHHKAHYKKIIEAWMKVMKKAKSGHRLALFYLANDVIQNSKRKNVHIFNEPWMGALKQATALVKNDKIKTQIERIFKVWGDRSVYESTFIAELQALLAVEKKSHVSADEKILADFKPQKMIDKIKKHKKMESEVSMKQTQLSNLKVDVCSSESLRQLKDKAHGTKFTKEFEEATSKLEEFVQILDKQQQERISLIEILEKGELFYNTQRKEAKIVANAYKNFGTRVSNLKQKLEERLPDLSSPVPSPTFDAPSPEDSSAECSPSKNEEENKDNVEAVDMEMSDDETDSHANTKANKATASPLESPASPDTSLSGKITTPINNSTETKSPSLVPVVVDTSVKSIASVPTPVIPNLLVASAAAQPSSLDARLSSLMQNLPAFTTGIQGSFLNPNSIPVPPVPGTNNLVPVAAGAPQGQANKDATAHALVNDTPLRTIPLPPPVGGASNAADGAGTPVKDEESGTGSATPLQDEEREANCVTAAAASTPAAGATIATDNQNAISEFLKKLSSSLSSAAHRSPQNNLAIGSQQSAWDQMQQAKDGGSRSTWFPDSPSNNTLNSQPAKAQLERHPPPLLPPPLPNMYFSGFSPMQRPALNPSPKRVANTRGSYDYNGSAANSTHYGTTTKDGTASTSGTTQQARPKSSLPSTLQPPPPPPPPLFPPTNPNIVELTQSHGLDGTDTINSLASTIKDSATPEELATTHMPSSNLKPVPLVSFADSESQIEAGSSANLERTRFREAGGDEKNVRRNFPTNVSKIETLSSRREPWSGNEAWSRGHGPEGLPNTSQEWGNVHDSDAQGHHGHYVQHRFPTGQRNFAPRHNLPPKRSWNSFENRDGSYGVGPPPPKRLAPRSQVFGAQPRPRWRPPYPNRY